MKHVSRVVVLGSVIAFGSLITACTDAAAEKSQTAAMSYLSSLKDTSEESTREVATLVASNKTAEAKDRMVRRLKQLDITASAVQTDADLLPSDRDKVVQAVRTEESGLRSLLARF